MVINAIEQQWRTELWTWRHACSKRYTDLVALFPDRVSIVYLDSIADVILFSAKTVSVAKTPHCPPKGHGLPDPVTGQRGDLKTADEEKEKVNEVDRGEKDSGGTVRTASADSDEEDDEK